MKQTKKLLSVFLAVLMLFSSVTLSGNLTDFDFLTLEASAAETASGTCGENLTWVLDDTGTLTISGTGAMTDFTPYDAAPWPSSRINAVVIENNVTSIGSYAFYYANACRSVSIPDSVTSIGESAFYSCHVLVSISLPDCVTSIGVDAFGHCRALGSITIPDGVTTIEDGTFYSCTNLSSIIIPDGVTNIGKEAFKSCTNLKSITIPNSVTQIGDRAFYGCNELDTVNYSGIKAQWNAITFGTDNACLTDANIECTFDVGGYYGDYFWWSIDEEGTLKIEGWGELDECEDVSLTPWYEYKDYINNVVFDYGIESIPANLVSGYVMESVTIPDTVVKIADNAFSGCDSITKAEFIGTQEEWNAVSVGSGNENLANVIDYVVLAKGNCGDSATWSLNKYTGVLTISGSGYMDDYTAETDTPWYSVREQIKEVVVGEDIESVGEFAFSGCTSLQKVTINYRWIYIAYAAFENCTAISEVYYVGSYKDWQSDVSINESTNECLVNASHFFTNEPQIDPTCVDVGYEEGTYCQNCKEYKTGGAVISATGIHMGGEATCNTNAVCSMCNQSYGELNPNNHKAIVKYDAKAPTLTQIGWDAYEICSDCGYTTYNELPVLSYVEGACGEAATWNLTQEGTLTISGEGDMYDYNYDSESAPWYEYAERVTTVIVGDSIKSIGDYAFGNCCNLENITIPDSIASIGYAAFNACIALDTVYYGGSEEQWNNIEIDNTENLNDSIINVPHVIIDKSEIPANCGDVGYEVGKYCVKCAEYVEGGAEISATGNHTGGEATCISPAICEVCEQPYGEINNDNHKNKVTITGTAETCGKDGLTDGEKCNDCNEILIAQQVIPATGNHDIVTYEGQAPTIEHVGWEAYEACNNCDYSTYVEIPMLISGSCGDNLIWIFDSQSGVLTISGTGRMYDYSWDTIPWFDYKKDIITIVIEDGVTSIGDNAFYYCDNFVNITIPDSVINFGSYTFAYCEGLESITIPGGITRLDSFVFISCRKLTTITIPVSLNTIEESAFSRCTALDTVYYGGSEEQWNNIYIHNSIAENDAIVNVAHVIISTEEAPANCVSVGYTSGEYCIKCSEYVSGHDEIPITGIHQGEANCAAKAVCINCGVTFGEINPDNHINTEIRNAVAEKCLTDGYTGDTYCLDCNTTVKTGELIPAIGYHSLKYDYIYYEKMHTVTCSACDFTTKEDCLLEADCSTRCMLCNGRVKWDDEVTHNMVYEIGNNGHTSTCLDCGRSVVASKCTYEFACSETCVCGRLNPDLVDHIPGEWAVTKQPTATEKGLKEIKCVTCNITLQSEEIAASGVTVSGTVMTFGDSTFGDTTLEFFKEGEETAAHTLTVSGSSQQEYSLEGITPGNYTVKVSKKNHVSRTYNVSVVADGNIGEFKLNLIGDLTGDGEIKTADIVKLNAHLRKTRPLSGYELSCADVTGEGNVTTADVVRLNAHLRGTKKLW